VSPNIRVLGCGVLLVENEEERRCGNKKLKGVLALEQIPCPELRDNPDGRMLALTDH